MKYEVKINDWSANLEVNIECDDFDLISEIQMAIESVVEQFHDFQDELEEEEEEEEDEDGSTVVFDDNDDTHTTITITHN